MDERAGWETLPDGASFERDLYSLYFAAALRVNAAECERDERKRTNCWLVLDLLYRGVSAVLGPEVAFPSLDLGAEGSEVHLEEGREGLTRANAW